MEEVDDKALWEINDDDLLMQAVIGGDHELFYLDACLRETFLS